MHSDKPKILLFYKEFEKDKFIKYDRYLKRIVRPVYNLFHSRQKKTGFAVSFSLLVRALQKANYDVRINDYREARRAPRYPVGIIGFPVILEHWKLPNPAVLGPSLYDHPMLAPDLMKDRRYRKYAVLAPWTYSMYAPVYGNRCFEWFAGIDLDEWQDLSAHPKKYDFIVYDKVRWDHDDYEGTLIKPVISELEKRGLSYIILRYGKHDHDSFRNALADSRGMIFLCEHETQGLAYQEAMASGVPILAWDRGYWADPLWKRYADKAPPASSVPFFAPACGETFKNMEDFSAALALFTERRGSYTPRQYVKDNLGMKRSADIYANAYFSLLEK